MQGKALREGVGVDAITLTLGCWGAALPDAGSGARPMRGVVARGRRAARPGRVGGSRREGRSPSLGGGSKEGVGAAVPPPRTIENIARQGDFSIVFGNPTGFPLTHSASYDALLKLPTGDNYHSR